MTLNDLEVEVIFQADRLNKELEKLSAVVSSLAVSTEKIANTLQDTIKKLGY